MTSIVERPHKCPIWRTAASIEPRTGHGVTVDSPRTGGRYFITDTAISVLRHRARTVSHKLTSWLIEQRILGFDCPSISSETVNQIEHTRQLSIQQRADNLLRYIRREISNIGDEFFFDKQHDIIRNPQRDWEYKRYMEMLAWSESTKTEELEYLLNYLTSQSWLEQISHGITRLRFSLTVRGYSYLAEIDHAVTDSSQAFVAMWFDESMQEIWENGLRPAITDAGYKPVRIDQKEHLNKIDDEIIAEIRRARFLVADFTHGEDGPRGGVYYEAGFAHGLNIPVVFTCRRDMLNKIHFDTRQYPHIVWETVSELRNRLAKRISAVLGDGPVKR